MWVYIEMTASHYNEHTNNPTFSRLKQATGQLQKPAWNCTLKHYTLEPELSTLNMIIA